MPSLILRRDELGQLSGLTEKDDRAFARWRKKLATMEHGDTLAFSYRLPRSPRYHARHFGILGRIFESQEFFSDPDTFRKWAEVGAGHVEWIPDGEGGLNFIPKSIDYISLDDEQFRPVHQAVMEFLRSERALRTLWPHRPWQKSWDVVDNWIEARR